jgi:hypothetical protein
MAKDWLSSSKRNVGNTSGGGAKGNATSAPKAGMGRKDGGKPQNGGPTTFGNSSGGGSGAKGQNHALNAPKGIGQTKG